MLHIRNMGILQFQPLRTSLPLKFTNASVKRLHFIFLHHEFRSRFSKQMISITIKKRFRSIYRVRESSQKPVDVSRENLLSRKTFLDSTYFCLEAKRQVSLYLSDLEMNWTSSFLVQSDKLAIVLHLLLAPVSTVGEASRARSISSSKTESGCGVAMPSGESQVDAVICWWTVRGLTRKSSCSVTCLSSVKCL